MKNAVFTLSLVLAGILILAAIELYTKKMVYSQFDGGGYSYLYYGGPDATAHFVSHPFSDVEKETLSEYSLQANLLATDTTEQKITKLSKVILDRLDKARGIPDQFWYNEGEFKQFQLVWNKELTGIYCTQFRHVYTSLANEAGIPTRVVHSAITIGPNTRFRNWGKDASDHTFAESYIAETGDWAIVDLDSKIILIRDPDGRFVNTIDLYDILMGNRHGNGFELIAYDSSTQTIQQKQFDTEVDLAGFYSKNTPYRLFFQENQIYQYERNGRGKYFFRPYSPPTTDRLVRKRFYAVAGAGVLLALLSCLYFVAPLRNQVRHMFDWSA